MQREFADQMKREFAACKIPEDYLAWERKWADRLAGRVRAEGVPKRECQPRHVLL
jgi:hypothetical protein